MTSIMRLTLLCAFACALFTRGDALAQEQQWKHYKTKQDVELYRRSISNSGIIEVKAVTVIDAAPEVIEAVLRDIPAYPEFMFNCIEGREIQKTDEEHILILNVTKMPWPVKTRDVVVRTEVKKDFANGRFQVDLVGVKSPESENRVPPIKGHVRMYELTGTFICEILERNRCRMTYIVHADPNSVPDFLVNWLVDDNPYGTLLGLKKMVIKPRYIELGRKSKYLGLIEKYFKQKS
jgi:hypothetical protein